MGKRSAAAALVTALTAGLLAVTASSASALSSEESSFVSKINAERRARGKSSLTVKSDLVSVARAHSAKMAAAKRIWHNSKLASQVGGNWTRLGENVGMGPSVTSLHKAFMNSPGHRANILGDYNQVGIGIVIRDDMIYVTEVFAKRSSSSVTRRTTTTTTTTRRAASAPSRRVAQRVVAAAPAARPVAKPATAAPQTVGTLLRMAGMDADEVDPATGAAAGF